jgi:hypothetical protein
MTASCILFVLYGPVPVKRKVTIVPRHAPPDMFAAQPVIRPSQLTPAVAIEQVAFRPRGESPQPLPRTRSARGTSSPRHRPSQSEDMQTDRVARVPMDTDSFLVDGH